MRSISYCSSPASIGSKSASAAICDRNPSGSKKVIFRVAVLPAVMLSQNSSRVTPPGATTPTPVTTVRLKPRLLRVHVAERRLRREGTEVEDDERVLAALVPEAMAHVERDHHPAVRLYLVRLVVQVRRDRAAHAEDELLGVGVVVLRDPVARRDRRHAHEAGGRADR